MPPPLLLARGRHESEGIYQRRLEGASSPPQRGGAYCACVLPQAEGEPDELAEQRLEKQAASAQSVVPYDANLESLDEFEARLQSGRASSGSSRRSD